MMAQDKVKRQRENVKLRAKEQANEKSLAQAAAHAKQVKKAEALKQESNNSVTATSQPTNEQSTADSQTQPATQEQQPQMTDREKKNQEAQDANTRLQPWYTGTAAAANVGQLAYYVTGSVSNVVGQGTAIVNSITGVISAIRSLI
ncbi:hypothetical protein [Lentilactobacillus curieae]|nr:hypothetical protein [Lentilactobacillus curieae]